MMKKNFMVCEICGKRLIERKTSGLFHFVFGRDPSVMGMSPVNIMVDGSVRMKCINRECRKNNPDHWNIFSKFPEFKKIEEQSD